MKTKTCSSCKKEFLQFIIINKKRYNLQSRKYCLECSPFKCPNTRRIHILLRNEKFKTCPKCNLKLELNEKNFYINKKIQRLYNWCKKCNHKDTIDRQRKNKRLAVEYMGGKCQICGYNKCFGALEFHHKNPEEKSFSISKIKSIKFESQKQELDKCILLCSNCHKETHENAARI